MTIEELKKDIEAMILDQRKKTPKLSNEIKIGSVHDQYTNWYLKGHNRGEIVALEWVLEKINKIIE